MNSRGTKLPHNEKYQLDANIYKSIPYFIYVTWTILSKSVGRKRAVLDLGSVFMQFFCQMKDLPQRVASFLYFSSSESIFLVNYKHHKSDKL